MIAATELACRVEELGLDAAARQLALTPDLLLAAVRGEKRLSPMRVLALRDGVELGPALAAYSRALRGSRTTDA